MTEIVKGLFGFSPQELATQRDQELTTKANAYAQLSPEQRATQMLYRGGNQLAGAVGGMLGAQDPQMKKSSDLQGILQGGDLNSVEGLKAMGDQAAALGYGTEAQQMYAKANEVAQSQATTRKATAEAKKIELSSQQEEQLRTELSALPPNATEQAVMAVMVKYGSPDRVFAALQASQARRDAAEAKVEAAKEAGAAKIEAARVAGATAKEIAQMRADTAREIASMRAEDRRDATATKREAADEKKTEQKNQAIAKLSSNEDSLDVALTTAEKALKLAPNSFLGGVTQAAFSSIPFTDSKALANLVSSLNSEKAIATLEELKSQSRTGATGFGALSEKELALLLNQTRALDPSDKMFKENLRVVMDGWSKVRKQVRESRLKLQGKTEEAQVAPMFATNPTTKQRITSTDGGKTWTPVR